MLVTAGVSAPCWISLRWSVGVAGGFVDAAAGCSPGHLAGSGLAEVPAGLLPPRLHHPHIMAPGTCDTRTTWARQQRGLPTVPGIITGEWHYADNR